MEKKNYYSLRNKPEKISFSEAIEKFKTVYNIIVDKSYLLDLAGISYGYSIPDSIENEARLLLPFQPFPISSWNAENTTVDQLFDTIEFLNDYVCRPFHILFESKDDIAQKSATEKAKKEGQEVFREYINMFLNDFEDGYQLNEEGQVEKLGTGGVELLYEATIIEYDFEHVDKYIKNAIMQWKQRKLTLDDRKAIIIDLANIFEWLKKTQELEKVLDSKDDKIIFDLANNFAIRHHNPNQKSNYDKNIWYSWMFHFYLATYHAAIRLIEKGKPA